MSFNKKISVLSLLLVWIAGMVRCGPSSGSFNPGSVVYIVERSAARLALYDIHRQVLIKKIKLKANLRHATMVFDPALRYGYVATRDGRLNRVNIQTGEMAGFVRTSKNSIGLAISQDGSVVAVSEYEPGSVTLVRTDSFEVFQRIPARISGGGTKKISRVTGLVDIARNGFVCALMDGSEIWKLVPRDAARPTGGYKVEKKYSTSTPAPFDALVTPEGRFYITGHFKNNRASLVDLWDESQTKARDIRLFPGKAAGNLPVKMPHMEAWASSGDKIYFPAPGVKKLFVLDRKTFKIVSSMKLIGDPVYSIVHPNGREIWVTFSGDADGKIQIIGLPGEKTRKIIDAGKKIYHLVFTPRGDRALVSANSSNEFIVYDAPAFRELDRVRLDSPSGIFGVWRAFKTGL